MGRSLSRPSTRPRRPAPAAGPAGRRQEGDARRPPRRRCVSRAPARGHRPQPDRAAALARPGGRVRGGRRGARRRRRARDQHGRPRQRGAALRPHPAHGRRGRPHRPCRPRAAVRGHPLDAALSHRRGVPRAGAGRRARGAARRRAPDQRRDRPRAGGRRLGYGRGSACARTRTASRSWAGCATGAPWARPGHPHRQQRVAQVDRGDWPGPGRGPGGGHRPGCR